MQFKFDDVLTRRIEGFWGARELQTNDCESWYARQVLHHDYRYSQDPLKFGLNLDQHLYYRVAMHSTVYSTGSCLALLAHPEETPHCVLVRIKCPLPAAVHSCSYSCRSCRDTAVVRLYY